MSDLTISFEVSGSIEQTIVLTDESYTPESLLEGLKSGEVFTSVSYSYDEKLGVVKKVELITTEIVDLPSDNPFKKVGYVKYQDSMDDLEMYNYELVS